MTDADYDRQEIIAYIIKEDSLYRKSITVEELAEILNFLDENYNVTFTSEFGQSYKHFENLVKAIDYFDINDLARLLFPTSY